MKLYLYNGCSTCKATLKYLKENEINVESIDISTTPPSLKELQKMLVLKKGQLKSLFNTSGLQYRELDMKNKLPTLGQDEAIELLSKNGMLIKRPFLLGKDFGVVGFKKEDWDGVFKG